MKTRRLSRVTRSRSSGRRRLCVALALSALFGDAAGAALIGFDLNRLNASGLQGPPDGLRALDYEFCIPAGPAFRAQVAAIDPSARFHPGSRGRIGCTPDQVLVLGNTHQDGFRAILHALADLPYVALIAEAVFE